MSLADELLADLEDEVNDDQQDTIPEQLIPVSKSSKSKEKGWLN